MAELFHCNHMWDYWKAVENTTGTNDDDDIEWLELSFYIEAEDDHNFGKRKNKKTKRAFRTGTYWNFGGIGKEGTAGDDIKPYLIEKGIDVETYRENFGLSLTPSFDIADLPIKIREKILVTDWEKKWKKTGKVPSKDLNFRPSIDLFTLIYEVFNELSFHGNERDKGEMSNKLENMVAEIKEGKTTGKTYKKVGDLFAEFEREAKSERLRSIGYNKNRISKDRKFRRRK